jgi:two-component system, chemotaxis family, chemotaxis protein CheY
LRTALVVEDNPLLRSVLSLLLAGDGWAVLEAADGREGLELARQSTPDVIVTDLRMPHLSGLGLARELRGDGSDSGTVMVAITSDPAGARTAEGSGLFDHVMGKPVDPRVLLQLVRELAAPRDPSAD